MSDQKFLSALNSIDKELSAATVASLDGSGLCEKYKKIRGFLESIIPVVKLVPVWGGKLAKAITFLMTLADTVCPA
jgi:hypothetical protein